MKFDTRALQILRNFSTINQSMVFKEGNELKTIAQSKSIFATAKIEATIERDFGIYDLPQFLSAITAFENPELTLGENSVTINVGKEKLNFVYSDTSLIVAPPSKEMKLPSVDIEFELNSDTLARVQKLLGTLNLPEISIMGDGSSIYMAACNSKNSGDSSYKVEVGDTDKEFAMYFLAENINLLPGDYKVEVCNKGISQFTAEDVTYWIAVEKHSKFPE